LVVGGPSVLAALASTAGLWKLLGQKWIEQRLGIGLEKFKAGQQKELEGFRSEQQKEMERLRHFLSSRISKIHEKEFEVLPKAWLMLNDLHGSVALALDLTFKTYPDFRRLPDSQFEEFLTIEPACRLSDYQKEALRKASNRQEYFTDAMAGVYLDDANEKQRIFHNYLIEHRIFMTDELRKKFGAADQSLLTALTSYSAGKGKDWELVHSGQEEVIRLKKMVDEVEQAVQERLHYEEA
jgi:hypothetical protein